MNNWLSRVIKCYNWIFRIKPAYHVPYKITAYRGAKCIFRGIYPNANVLVVGPSKIMFLYYREKQGGWVNIAMMDYFFNDYDGDSFPENREVVDLFYLYEQLLR